ncbi:lysozyme inhibitor LprI family protein [[Erwinia] mediterraneensis]|uniref:lysozyme inhibitor LprI family protein n=1 Tax=[Erwinia] mediterraneensis TaxID=2161819 RepID=UPI00103121A1|nr:lysozyme inhibitor LprI family protein [[Erwinia] mediterraneensis]
MYYRLLLSLLLCSAPLFSQAEDAVDCSNATTTTEINQCMATRLNNLEAMMQRYYAQAITRASQGDEANSPQVTLIEQAQTAWLHYRDRECDAVYQAWSEGTIRGAMALGCKITLTRARIHTLWQNWIAPMDDAPPDLPEPQFDDDHP